jgi:hypothetical protein
MRGFDIFSFLPEKRHRAPASDATFIVWRRVWHVAATALREQRRILYFGNLALGLTIFKHRAPPTALWATAPYLQALLTARTIITLNRSLPARQVYEPVLLIL